MKLTKIIFLLVFTIFLSSHKAYGTKTSWQDAPESAAKVRLFGSFYQDQSKETKLIAALHFKIDHGWKIYGPDSGNFGLPPSLDFNGSVNYGNHSIIWPKAEIAKETIGDESFHYSFYKDEIILPIDLSVLNHESPTELKLKINYGICKDVCIPADAEFSLAIPQKHDTDSLELIQPFYPSPILPVKVSIFNGMLFYTILLALVGGAILNIMPCVLPVLSIKLLSVINHLDSDIKRIRFAFLSTIVGILFCFIIFALLATIVKIGGDSLNWGFQFQNIYFLIFLILILTFFTANLFGIFEITFEQVLASFIDKKISEGEKKRNIFIPNFLSGILAVMLATPCSAPFLGAAISFALTQTIVTIFIIFIFIGIGFALPYLILSYQPSIVYLLPKPGKWMLKLKKLMAYFLILTILWLIYILSDNANTLLAFTILFIATALFFTLKLSKKSLKILLTIILIILGFSSSMLVKSESKPITNNDNLWQNFDEKMIPILVAEGKTVVVDITADWCLTCKFNKLKVLQDKEVVEKLKMNNIISMRGDITKPNEEVMNYLHKNGRFAIPFNAVYGPNAKNGLLTKELLNKKEFLELIDKAS